MRYTSILGVFCVMLAMAGIVSADVYAFTDSYDTMSMQGILTFDENGIINGAVVAGTNNGAMDVTQYAETENGNVLVYQYGDIEGGAGFATTAARDGSGNSGGSLATFTDGSMVMGQGTIAGSVSLPSNSDAAGVFTSDTGSQVSVVIPDISLTIGGVATGQVAEIEGSSGYASTGARNVNGASARNAASFIEGGMILAQGSASGDLSLTLPDLNTAYESSLGEIDETGAYGLTAGAAIAAQGVAMRGRSGYASTTVTNSQGATASSAASFSNGGMGTIQAGIGYDVDLTHPVSSEGDPVDLTLGGAIVGQGVDMEGSAGSVSTTVSDGNGASGQSSSSFTNGGMGTIQAGAAGDATLNVPDIIPLGGMDLSLDAGGAIVGQGVEMGGDTGSASTTVSDGNGASGQSSASFTNGGMGAIQAGAAGDVSLVLSNISSPGRDVSIGAGGAIVGQGVFSDSFSTITASSYSQAAGNSLAQMNALAEGAGSFNTTQFAGGIHSGNFDIAVAGQDIAMDGVSSGFASGYSSDSNGNAASVRTFVNGGEGTLAIDGGSIIPVGIIAGAGDIGGISGAIAVHDDVLIRGRSGGLRTEAGNSTGGSAYVDASFTEGGKLMSENGPFLGMTGAALSVQYEGTNYMGAAEWNLNSTSLNTNIETEITDIAKPTPATTPGTYDAYSYNLPPGILPSPIPNPNSEIWRHP